MEVCETISGGIWQVLRGKIKENYSEKDKKNIRKKCLSWLLLVGSWPLLAALGPLLVALGPLLGRLLAALGLFLSRSWPLLGCSWAALCRSWAALGRSWGALVVQNHMFETWAFQKPLKYSRKNNEKCLFWPLLGPLGNSWAALGRS